MLNLIKIYSDIYNKILPILKIKYKYKSYYNIPNLKKIVINMSFKSNLPKDFILKIKSQLQFIVGQKFYLIKSKKSISNFQLRKNVAIALKTTLRGVFMYNFIQKLIHIALPRIKDFRGFNLKTDSAGNFNFGINDCGIFPEVFFEDNTSVGFNISLVFNKNGLTSISKEPYYLFLDLLKFPVLKLIKK
ncbi:50S ribosomal protein L5 [Candidatus Pinguicoccus supinus]|uniref:50S ribosomal protein L5 n=1 Tax=Candidatus Pinguicoccus supinus TaxID=2529394 RepID=A0A7T0BRL7_9BACT|nr:50S ribosomal protein L5 [Candidatus Pinguicoccus supinus]